MKLSKARVMMYRSVRDSGWFEVEGAKSIFVGPNEAGKTAVLQALQHLNPPDGIKPLDALRDYPRSEYNDITSGRVDPGDVTVVEAHFALDDSDLREVGAEFSEATYVFGRQLDNSAWRRLDGGPAVPSLEEVRKDLLRLAQHAESNVPDSETAQGASDGPEKALESILSGKPKGTMIDGSLRDQIDNWLTATLPHIDEDNEKEEARFDRLREALAVATRIADATAKLEARRPVFVLFGNYFRVRPLVHLKHLADRIEKNTLDDRFYDYGNTCLLKLLGFSARELSNLGKAAEPPANDPEALQTYRDQLDKRQYQLNAASVRLTREIRRVWSPDPKRQEADNLRIIVDGQYLKVVVEDELGVEIELNQRSEGFQWLVSFFVVFFAEAADRHENAVLLLDEPGLSLHGLKQREFRKTVTRLAESNQTLYTTHSPFLVGPNELDLVRVVEMSDRSTGTKVHTTITADDPAALLPLQEALGYDLAQSLFSQKRNLVVEGLTDLWYLESVAQLLRAAGLDSLDERIALVPAQSAGKVVYYATILHAQSLKVAALLDSDSAGDQAAQQDALVHTLGNKRILRTKDAYAGAVGTPEIEDTLRETLVTVAHKELGWDVRATSKSQPKRPIVELLNGEIKDFSKYKLAKAFVRWTRDHEASDLASDERAALASLMTKINNALK